MTAHDVIVVGLGGIGSSAANHLARRGQRVLGIERFGPAHDRGSSHGGSRIIRQSYFEDPAYVPLAQRAYELLEEVEAATGVRLLTVTGGLFLGRPEHVTFSGSLFAAELWGLPHEVLDADDVRRRFPTIHPPDGYVAFYEPIAGVVRPEATVQAHLDLATVNGADLRFECPIVEWSASTTGVTVRTADGEVHRAGHLVVAPGAWAPRMLADLGVDMRVERLVQHWFAPVAGEVPFVDHPIWICELEDGAQVYGFPAVDGPGRGVKVAFFRESTPADPDALDRGVSEAEIAVIRAALDRVVPSAAGEHLRHAACMYTTTPDEHFVIARHPAHDRVTVACGMSGHGFKFTPVIGEILADLAIEGTTRHPIELFDPLRFTT